MTENAFALATYNPPRCMTHSMALSARSKFRCRQTERIIWPCLAAAIADIPRYTQIYRRMRVRKAASAHVLAVASLAVCASCGSAKRSGPPGVCGNKGWGRSTPVRRHREVCPRLRPPSFRSHRRRQRCPPPRRRGLPRGSRARTPRGTPRGTGLRHRTRRRQRSAGNPRNQAVGQNGHE
jgi:hypothetical protein